MVVTSPSMPQEGAAPDAQNSQIRRCSSANFGGAESGSTDVVKGYAFASHDTDLNGSNLINANDNVSFVAANDNNVAAVALAA